MFRYPSYPKRTLLTFATIKKLIMPLADNIALALRLAHEHLESIMDDGSLKDCADIHGVQPSDLKECLQFLDNLLHNQ